VCAGGGSIVCVCVSRACGRLLIAALLASIITCTAGIAFAMERKGYSFVVATSLSRIEGNRRPSSRASASSLRSVPSDAHELVYTGRPQSTTNVHSSTDRHGMISPTLHAGTARHSAISNTATLHISHDDAWRHAQSIDISPTHVGSCSTTPIQTRLRILQYAPPTAAAA
jgi:hypothetical protein